MKKHFPNANFINSIMGTVEYMLSDDRYDYYLVGDYAGKFSTVLVVYGQGQGWQGTYIDLDKLPALAKIHNRLALT